MAKHPTKFERDLADLHGDADVEIIEMEPGDEPRRRYRVVTREKPFMADQPPAIRYGVATLGIIWSLVLIILSGTAVIISLWFLWAIVTS